MSSDLTSKPKSTGLSSNNGTSSSGNGITAPNNGITASSSTNGITASSTNGITATSTNGMTALSNNGASSSSIPWDNDRQTVKITNIDARGAAFDLGLSVLAGAGPEAFLAKRALSRRGMNEHAGRAFEDGAANKLEQAVNASGSTGGWHGMAAAAANMADGVDNSKKNVEIDAPSVTHGESWASQARKYNKAARDQGVDVAEDSYHAAVNSLIGDNKLLKKAAGKVGYDTGSGSTAAITAHSLRKSAKEDLKNSKKAARRAERGVWAARAKSVPKAFSKKGRAEAKADRAAAKKKANSARYAADVRDYEFKAMDNHGVRGAINKAGNKIGNAVGNLAEGATKKVANFAGENAIRALNFAGRNLVRAGRGIAHGAKELARRITARVKNIWHTIKFIFTPPQLFILLAVILVISLILNTITILQTFGPSNIDCSATQAEAAKADSSSGGGASITNGVNWNDNAKTVAKAFQKAGFSKAATAAALGNFQQESGVGTTDINSKSGATGLGQWVGDRLTAMKALAASEGKDWTDMSAQADYAIQEASNAGNWLLFTWAGVIHEKYPEQGSSGSDMMMAWATTKGDDAGLEKGTYIWVAGWERPGIGEAMVNQRVAYTKAYYKLLDEIGGSWTADGSAPPNFGGGVKTDGTANSATSKGETTCKDKAKDSNAGAYGAIGGAKECDAGKCDFSWLCDSIGVCKNGDAGDSRNIYRHLEYGYQCVTFAWMRASSVYGTSGWTWVQGNGGDIWSNAQGQPGWTVDTTPHPGDLISGHGHPFAHTTHVAFVEKVESDPSGWKIYISEGNYAAPEGSGGWHGYHTRWLTKDQALTGDNHFLRNSAWKAKQDAAAK